MWTVTMDNHSTVSAYKDAYGITHKEIIKELQSLASEKLIHHLGSQGLNWTPTTPLKDYYDQFTVLCPAIADMYDIFFASVPLTITFLEQGFTIVHTIAYPNMATLTTSRSIKLRKNISYK